MKPWIACCRCAGGRVKCYGATCASTWMKSAPPPETFASKLFFAGDGAILACSRQSQNLGQVERAGDIPLPAPISRIGQRSDVMGNDILINFRRLTYGRTGERNVDGNRAAFDALAHNGFQIDFAGGKCLGQMEDDFQRSVVDRFDLHLT